MRVFLDANVLFSAAYRESGIARRFFTLARAEACELVSSGFAIEEARRNIRAKHPEREADLDSLLAGLTVCREATHATLEWASSQNLPPKDAPILAAAADARCTLLVTGDRRDFGRLFGRRLRGTVVLMPVEALELLIGVR
mgnify:CR=1 FL=1